MRWQRAVGADRGAAGPGGLLPRALVRRRSPTTPSIVLGIGEYGAPFVSFVAARQRLRRAVPPREVLGRTASRCCATSSGSARPCTPRRDPLSRDRHRRRPGGAARAGRLRRRDRLRRRARSRPRARGSRRARASCTSSTSTARGRARRRTSHHLERIAGELGVPVQCGGGLRSLEAVARRDRGRRRARDPRHRGVHRRRLPRRRRRARSASA